MIKRPIPEKEEAYQVWSKSSDGDEALVTFTNEVDASKYWWKLVNETNMQVKLKKVTTETVRGRPLFVYSSCSDPNWNATPETVCGKEYEFFSISEKFVCKLKGWFRGS